MIFIFTLNNINLGVVCICLVFLFYKVGKIYCPTMDYKFKSDKKEKRQSRYLIDKIDKSTLWIKVHIIYLVKLVLLWGLLFYINIILLSIMVDLYSKQKSNGPIVFLTLSLTITVIVSTVIIIFMILGETMKALVIFSSVIVNVFLTFSPLVAKYVPKYEELWIYFYFISDFVIAWWLMQLSEPMREKLSIIEYKEKYTTYSISKGKIEVEKTRKTYPILLPILVAILTATGTVAAALLKK